MSRSTSVLAGAILLAAWGCQNDPSNDAGVDAGHDAGPVDSGAVDAGSADAGGLDACVGLACHVAHCINTPTSLSGTVYAPNGTLPLPGVQVYVPSTTLPAMTDELGCPHCGDPLPGSPLARAITDETGHFTLEDVPSGAPFVLVLETGRWRRELTISTTVACQDTQVPDGQARLPRTQAEGHLPRIAVSTGSADALECLVHKLGVADTEFTSASADAGGRVHLYNGNGAATFATGFEGGTGAFAPSTDLWSSVTHLSAYDQVWLSCEGAQNPLSKSQASLQALHDYAGNGGRVLMTHWHNLWIGGEIGNPSHGLADWELIGTFDYAASQTPASTIATIDTSVDGGAAFAAWMVHLDAGTDAGQVAVTGARYTLQSVTDRATRRLYLDPAVAGRPGVQLMDFTAPQDRTEALRCGRVAYSELHASADSASKASIPYPGGCSTGPLTPQELALAYEVFFLSTCVGH